MKQTNSEARFRLVATAADMLRRRGLKATSIRDLAKVANAPLGSTYHYFPGGKQQVVNEAIVYAGEKILQGLRSELRAGPVEGLHGFLAQWRRTITKTDFRAGCPVIAVTIEEPTPETAAALETAANVLSTWENLLADSLREHGADEQSAKELATLIISSVEGALMMCRAKRDTTPLDYVSAQLEKLIRAAIS